MFFIAISASIGQSRTCSGFGAPLMEGWKKLYKTTHKIGAKALKLTPLPNEVTQFIEDASVDMHDFVFNKNKQSWTTLGPRDLFIPDSEPGKLAKVGVGGRRQFVTAPSLYDEVDITVVKSGGKAKTDVTICTYDAKTGNKMHIQTYTFKKGKGNETWRKTIKNAYGKSISVFLKNKSVANNFHYEVKTKGRVDMSKYTGKQANRTAAKGKAKAKAKRKFNNKRRNRRGRN